MRFEWEGLSYSIEFERKVVLRPRHVQPKDKEARPKVTVYTTARIIKHLKDKTVTTVREGTVGYYFKDRFSYEAGRKAALTKALYDAPTLKGGTPLMGQTFTKAFRSAVWTAYHGRTGAGA
jgi:hypothetical protein